MLECTVVSPIAQSTVSEATGLVVRATNGEIGILAGHIPTVAQLVDGSTVRVSTAEGERRYHIGSNSFLRYSRDSAVVLTSSFEEEI